MSEEDLDLRKTIASYLGIVFRAIGYWKWGVAVCLLVVAAGTAYAATRKKVWRSHTRIRVVSTRVTSGFDSMDQDQIQMDLKRRIKAFISADRYLQDIVDEFGLYREIKSQRGWTDQEVLMFMRGKIETGVFEGDEFGFTFYDWAPRKAQAVTHKLAENFMDLEKGASSRVYNTKLGQVESQLKQLLTERDKLVAQETEFRRINSDLIEQLEKRRMGGVGLDPVGSGDSLVGSDETKARASDSPHLRRLRMRLRDLEETHGRLRAKAMGGAAANNSAACQQRNAAQANANKLKGWFDRVKNQYTPQHPDYQNAKNRWAQADARFREMDGRCRDQQRTAREPSAELVQVQREITTVREQVKRLAAHERRKRTVTPEKQGDAGTEVAAVNPGQPGTPSLGIRRLKSVEDVDASLKTMKTKMEPITQQIQELDAQRLKLQFQRDQQSGGGARQYVVIDQARVPSKPSGPNRTKIALSSAAGGLVIGLGLMLMLGFLDTRVYRPSDLSRLDHIPLLTSIPDFEGDVREIAAEAAISDGDGYGDQPPMGPQG